MSEENFNKKMNEVFNDYLKKAQGNLLNADEAFQEYIKHSVQGTKNCQEAYDKGMTVLDELIE